jgi:hypothetical protein
VAAAFVAGLLTAALTATGLIYELRPDLRPDPKLKLAAQLSVETVEPNVTLADYLQRAGKKIPGAQPTDLQERGYLIYMRVKIEGRKNQKTLSVDQTLYSVNTRRRIAGQQHTRDSLLDIETPHDEWIHLVWVADPYARPTFARLAVFDDDVMLAFADTPRLRK